MDAALLPSSSAHAAALPWGPDLQAAFEATVASEAFFAATAVAGGLWLAASGFLAWRRRAANLTPVAAATAAGVSPDFLRVDHASRSAALERGDAFEARLQAREAAEAAAGAAAEAVTPASRLTGLVAALMSAFTLVSMVFGAVMQVRWIGHYAEDLSAPGRVAEIVRAHPVAFGVSIAVALLQITRFARARRQA